MNLALRVAALVLLYILAAPMYLALAVMKVTKNRPASRAIREGTVECPHCGQTCDLDVKSTCPRCRRTELGNRLRCKCGYETTSFDCDYCGVTIDVL